MNIPSDNGFETKQEYIEWFNTRYFEMEKKSDLYLRIQKIIDLNAQFFASMFHPLPESAWLEFIKLPVKDMAYALAKSNFGKMIVPKSDWEFDYKKHADMRTYNTYQEEL